MTRVVGQSAAGAPFAAVLAWAWNMSFPDMQMPAEVAAPLGGLVGPIIAYLVSWLPSPN